MSTFSLTNPRTRGIAYVLFAVVIWSGWMLLSRYSVRGSLTAYDITALRFGVAGTLLLPVLIKKGLMLGPYGWKGSLLFALLMGAPYNTIGIFGMRYIPISQAAAILNAVMLIVTTLLGLWLLKEKTTRSRLLGVALSVMGIGCMLYAGHNSQLPGVWVGAGCFILGGIMWASYTLCARAWKVDPLHAAAAVCGLSLLLYLPVYLLFIPSHISMSNLPEVLVQAGYQGIINSIVALVCFNRGLHLLGATISSAFLPLIPIFSTLMAIPLLGEGPGAWEWTGIFLVSTGVFLSTGFLNRFKRRQT